MISPINGSRISIVIIFLISILASSFLTTKNAESSENDMEFIGSVEYLGKTIEFAKITVPLKEGERPVSSLDGRHLMIAIVDGDVIHEFYEIDAYSSIFITDKSIVFEDLTGDLRDELVLFIDPHESIAFAEYFKISYDEFVNYGRIIGHSHNFHDGIIEVTSQATCDNWSDCIGLGSQPPYSDIDSISRIDFYMIDGNEIVRVHHEDREDVYRGLIQEYKRILSLIDQYIDDIDQGKLINRGHWFNDELLKKRAEVEKLIEEYQGFLSQVELMSGDH